MICKNCYIEVKGKRDRVNCSMCDSPMHKDCAIEENGELFCDECYTDKAKIITSSKYDFKVPEIIRRSYIDTYKSCPYKFYLQVIKGIEEDDYSIYAQIGIDLHDLFNKACNDLSYKQKDMMEEFAVIWNSYQEERFLDKEQKLTLYHRSMNSINSFYMILPILPPNPFTTEETIQFSVGEELPIVQTTMDRIDLINGELNIADWKTGKTMVGNKLSTDIQAPLYIYGIRETFKKPVRSFTFYYLNEDKIRTFVRTQANEYTCRVRNRDYIININNTLKETQAILSQIMKGNFNIPNNVKNMFFTCKMCYLQKQGHCKGADTQSWNQIQGGK